jgi:hypothetical protein
MARKQSRRGAEENPGGSVKETPGITSGRQRQERRTGSGNMRKGSIQNAKAAEHARPIK